MLYFDREQTMHLSENGPKVLLNKGNNEHKHTNGDDDDTNNNSYSNRSCSVQGGMAAFAVATKTRNYPQEFHSSKNNT